MMLVVFDQMPGEQFSRPSKWKAWGSSPFDAEPCYAGGGIQNLRSAQTRGRSRLTLDVTSRHRDRPKHFARGIQGGNCGILRQTRDGSLNRRALKWHLLLMLSVLVSCDC